MFKIKKALISVYDKTNLDLLAPFFEKYKIKIYSSGGTSEYLNKINYNLDVTEISNLTGFPEMLDGRVKTLHPKVHGGILAKKSKRQHISDCKKNNIDFFDLVIVNLYPFEKSINKNESIENCIENIDIGGATLIRSAAKNFEHVLVVVSKSQIISLTKILKEKEDINLKIRKNFAREAFRYTAYYESVISNWFNEEDDSFFRDDAALPMKKIRNLRYGENPHQKASIFKFGKNNLNQLSGKEMSFNNINDIDIAVSLAFELTKSSCVIVKHGNPCGVAVSNSQDKSYKLAFDTDPVSAFGGIVAFNETLDTKTSKEILKNFTEIVIAPKISKSARKILIKKKNLILIEYKKKTEKIKNYEIKTSQNFLMVQERNTRKILKTDLAFVTKKKPNSNEIEDMLFGSLVCKFVNSNAVILVERKKVLGMGVGQTNRIEAANHAIKKGLKKVKNIKNVVLVSDGFFPFSDIIDLCKKVSLGLIVQPGGSIRDKEIIQKANNEKIKMVFTGIRNFKH
ncbi:MAG: bifunctional phosphoribosylaminoimidazolecarboxamide formyltransferase/IMP cyclohydrolase PurH [Rickettsiales bacterium]|nr:bifunctional phosphoribosylaminoimidazolecarboxamide formyltransferase/IMP cyclohydrolase PurH [Rickettsiales bacterium]